MGIGMALDGLDPYHLKRRFEAVNGAIGVAALSRDLAFLRNVRRAALPLPLVDRPAEIDASGIFPPFNERPVDFLRSKRVAVVASGGSGACVSLVGVARALEEAGVEPAMISSCSGGAIWGAMWAGGMSAQQMAEFSLDWRPEDYLDIQWAKLPRFALSALRGFTGIAKGEAIERLLDDRLAGMTAAETPIPFTSIVWNMDLGRIEYFGSRETPEVTMGELVRIAIALPLFVEAVPVRDHLYVDGGIVDVFPAEPVIEAEGIDHVIGVNFILPSGFRGDDITGWHDRAGGILEASRQLQQGNQMELARRSAAALGGKLTLIDAVHHSAVTGVAFYDLFIDRTRWPDLMRQGYDNATRVLDELRAKTPGRRSRARNGTGARATTGT
jgi:NTE family protein